MFRKILIVRRKRNYFKITNTKSALRSTATLLKKIDKTSCSHTFTSEKSRLVPFIKLACTTPTNKDRR